MCKMCVSKWESEYLNGIEINRFDGEEEEFEVKNFEDLEAKLEEIFEDLEFGAQKDFSWTDYDGHKNLVFEKEVMKGGEHQYWLYVNVYEEP